MYLAAITLYTSAMVALYLLFLRNKPFFKAGRAYLILSALLPLVLPLISAPAALRQGIQKITALQQLTLPQITISGTPQQAVNTGSVLPWVYIAYAAVSLMVLLWYVTGIIRLRTVIAHGQQQARACYTLVTSSGHGPGSFGKYIFFPGSTVDETVLMHELVHVNRRHTADIMLVALLQVCFWPNLFLFFIMRELRELHEFEADAGMNLETDEYIQMILSAVFKTSSVRIMHSFINHPLKRRIMMLKKNDGKASPLKAIVKVTAALCTVVAIGVGIQSCGKKSATPIQPAVSSSKEVVEGPVVTRADVMPEFKGSLTTYLGSNLKYPEYARKNKIEGKVFVKFLVTSNGTVVQAEAVKSPDTSLTRAALEVIRQMPAWEPAHMNDGKKVNVWFYLPVFFKLD